MVRPPIYLALLRAVGSVSKPLLGLARFLAWSSTTMPVTTHAETLQLHLNEWLHAALLCEFSACVDRVVRGLSRLSRLSRLALQLLRLDRVLLLMLHTAHQSLTRTSCGCSVSPNPR
jgi:EAL domain-containing protein (putative c-di-GMP-specific phosphodiesterase class I)